MNDKPRIAIILGENTSAGGARYDMSKSYFDAVVRAGGLPFGIPYVADLTPLAAREFDGFISVGGRINFPTEWYVDGDASRFPRSDRLAVDRALMEAFLERDKPVLGICNGMQMLACLHGSRMVSEIRALRPDIIPHDGEGLLHPARIVSGTALARMADAPEIEVNTFHREAVVEVSRKVVACAHAPDGVVEAIEVPAYRFAIGLQWHPEAMPPDHRGHRVFDAFVEAARQA
ncbi:gamma-glutamyl-gamma-aminobutyrate hydrolase family protein [Microvirga thermotolerans]|uniref:Gamma-glutamyl-gamma-aminobutyrate hydrolase family protein n=1 Tax=Microvirga thermotolerans TaxID=2651334 RepID=A0A5P9JUU1_9HYPH|nr:gamma-glutamyl-gamma-aminobutyrate hydrolase family protein [Microvirga thermotolerans]QFU16193.1 gamma-glutamyl-gamma-aminobutyrate hydrolase family protein [Microvirga thermotolerans]